MGKRLHVTFSATLTAALTSGLLTLTGGTASAAITVPKPDFNGDGFADTAISAPQTTVNGRASAGTVAVVYGSATGLDKTRRQVISQDTSGIPGTAESGDEFGWDQSAGDMDGDGYTDLVVVQPNERIGSTGDAGTVTILWGSAAGLTSGSDLKGPFPENHHWFGGVVAVGDYNGDGKKDLAVNGTPGINIFYGPLTRTGQAAKRQDLDPYAQARMDVGEVMIAGNVTGDAADELLMMGNYETSGGDYVDRSILYRGGTSGLAPAGKLAGGYTAAIGDINKDGYGDVVTGHAFEKRSWSPDGALGGAITVTYGSATGLSTTRTPVKITQDTAGIPGGGEADDHFGWDVAIGDVNGDGYGDVAVGSEGEDLGGVLDAGLVTVLRGSSTGLTGTGAVAYEQNTSGIPGGNEPRDSFGFAVGLPDANADGRSELLVGSRDENAGTGMVWYLRSSATGGLSTSGVTYFSQSGLGGPGGFSSFGSRFAH
ncbi:FG-GAP and VCBS repeat-containing protein [Streptomyces polyrhachis]|uniref:FG-GAP and VCBS repeat-containing protein n=1 Tax=Streptomyces polyrhachis TaxID=1282885 RepID=A0ABW2G8R8_9ACTN